MKVQLIAHTVLFSAPGEYIWHHPSDSLDDDAEWETDADQLAEVAGRLCYESWERPNPKTATNKGYLGNIIAQRHFSVLEHASASFYIEGVSRSLLAELSRHRHLSFSVVSQRYVDHGEDSGKEAITPPVFDDFLESTLSGHMEHCQEIYDYTVKRLLEQGYSRKEARGAARAFLPEATETAMVVTGNMRAWREIIEKRNSTAADAEIRNLAQSILAELKVIAPNTFQDFEDTDG